MSETKDEIVDLFKDIEIINGVEVNWSKFKARNTIQTRKGYIGLCEQIQKNGHTLESDYIGDKTKVDINFNCGHPVHSVSPNNYKRGQGCPECVIKNKMDKSKEELYRIAKERGHKILGKYINNSTKILIDFNCGHQVHNITPHMYKQGKGCPICSGKSAKYAKQELYELAKNNEHTILGKYVNNSTKISINFNCGHKSHNITPAMYKQGKGCPYCKASKGEMEVSRVFKEMNISYQEQYKFENCRNVLPLPFDFYIPEFNICIEYDGAHHYKPVAYYKKEDSEYQIAKAKKIAEERLKETQRRDKIKTDYCRNNGINLIRIPYWEFDNIEKIIKKELSKFRQAVA